MRKLTIAQRAAFRALQLCNRNYRSFTPIPSELVVLVQKLGVLSGRIGGSKHNSSELSITLQQLLACSQRKQEIIEQQQALQRTPPKPNVKLTTPRCSAKSSKKIRKMGAPIYGKTFHHFTPTRPCGHYEYESPRRKKPANSYIPPHKRCGYCPHPSPHPITPILTSPKIDVEDSGKWSGIQDSTSKLKPKKTRVFSLSTSAGLMESAYKRKNMDQEIDDVPPVLKQQTHLAPPPKKYGGRRKNLDQGNDTVPPHSPLHKQRTHFVPTKRYDCGSHGNHGVRQARVGNSRRMYNPYPLGKPGFSRKRGYFVKKRRPMKRHEVLLSFEEDNHICRERHPTKQELFKSNSPPDQSATKTSNPCIPPSPLLEDPPLSNRNSPPKQNTLPRHQQKQYSKDTVSCKIHDLEMLRDEVSRKLEALIGVENELESSVESEAPVPEKRHVPQMRGMLNRLEELVAEEEAIRRRWNTIVYKDMAPASEENTDNEGVVCGCHPTHSYIVPSTPHENFVASDDRHLRSQYTPNNRCKHSAGRFRTSKAPAYVKTSKAPAYVKTSDESDVESREVWEDEESDGIQVPYSSRVLTHEVDDRVTLPLTVGDTMEDSIQHYRNQYAKYLQDYAGRHQTAENSPWEMAEE